MTTNSYRVGLDVGSTTAKLVVTDQNNKLLFSKYERHNADVINVVSRCFNEIRDELGDVPVTMTVTGSVGMGLAERFGIPFIQEVVAATEFVKKAHPDVTTIIDIGGEDAKIVYLNPDGNADLRMNGNCAGGTGAFIDQMALLLNVHIDDMDALATQAERTYPIASRCGVFSKTDVQNLISKNVSKADIAASIFHAVAVQTIVTLSHGYEVVPKILFCGGPLTFIPALQRAFVNYLNLESKDYMVPEKANIIPAWGSALATNTEKPKLVSEWGALLQNKDITGGLQLQANRLERIFESEEEYEAWKEKKRRYQADWQELKGHKGFAYLGIDSGSTTTKIVVTDEQGRLLFTDYRPNDGNPIQSVKTGLKELNKQCRELGLELKIHGSCSTGYGEDLVKAAFNLKGGIIETIAHYTAARQINPDVSFILDIGGQDMKAIFVENGVLSRMEINEACSSGCGSFIQTFAQSLKYSVNDFATAACLAENPCDLGTRCTVFMNSKVKQVLREGATIGDIAAGLSYSVVKNCLYKVLKLKRPEELGSEIVVQGGTMRNDSVVRALELLTGVEVGRSSMPELMGALGCALHAKGVAREWHTALTLDELLNTMEYTTREVQCKGCENQCYVNKYAFANGNVYFSGNKCEKVFSNQGTRAEKGRNMSVEKYTLLFDRENHLAEMPPSGLKVGIPRVLNTYENYPFWQALFNACGIETALSAPSTFRKYEAGVHSVMSDNICFPAKLVHSHIYDLIDKEVDRIFFPYVVFEKQEGKTSVNSYNCPIVSGYSEVIKSAINPAIPVDSPVITFKDAKLLERQCVAYLADLGVSKSVAKRAVKAGLNAQEQYEATLQGLNMQAFEESRADGRLTILLAGRPYHTDPLVQHKLSDMVSDMGATVITEDIVRGNEMIGLKDVHHVSQWAYINRILRAAQWVAEQGNDVHFVQMTSFGCGPDAFLIDEVKGILARHGKSLTLLKIDDVNNIGSIKLRVRSVVESLKYAHEDGLRKVEPFVTTREFKKEDRKRTILIPYFTDYLSPLIPPIFELMGYNVEALPESNIASADYGLMYANNEVCYPATLVIGDLIKAVDSGKYDVDNTAVIITQTGGQCRASNYIALIKSGLVQAGYPQVPVLSLAMGDSMINEQEGFRIPWLKILPITLAAILFGDALSKLYHAAAVRETAPGATKRLREKYLETAKGIIRRNKASELYDLLDLATKEFNTIVEDRGDVPRVGVVGEIFLKFNSFAHKNVVNWLVDQGIEVMPPVLLDFFTQGFVNWKDKKDTKVERSGTPEFVMNILHGLVSRQIRKVNKIGSQFKYWMPFHDIFHTAESGKEVMTLSAQFGEGWLLPAEIVTFAKQGVNHVISLQPFGCIANHIISKGVEKKIKSIYPQMNLLNLDFDSGVSDVNIMNRILLLTNNLTRHAAPK